MNGPAIRFWTQTFLRLGAVTIIEFLILALTYSYVCDIFLIPGQPRLPFMAMVVNPRIMNPSASENRKARGQGLHLLYL